MHGTRYSVSDLQITPEGLKAGSRLATRGSILLLVRGSILHQKIPVGIADTDVAFNQDVKAIRVKDDLADAHVIDNWYLFYWIKANEGRLLSMVESTGIGAGKLDTKQLQELIVDYPDWGEQRRIVACCKAVEEKEIINHQINQTLEQMAQAIFKSWFVDFEPVRAKMEAKKRWHALQPGNEPASPVCYAGEPQPLPDLETYMNLAAMQAISGKTPEQLARMEREQPDQYAQLRATAELFPSAMQDSELGEIPEGWEALPLSDTVELIGGGTPKKSEPSYWNGDICWFSVKDAPCEGNVFVIDTVDKITDAGLKGSSTKLLPVGTTIITARGTVGKLALTGVVTAMNQSCYGVVGSDGSGPYLNYLRLHRAVDTLKRNTHGAVFDTITRATFETVIQAQASLELRQRFDAVVGPMFEAIKSNLHQTRTLTSLRDTLLPKLLSGELTLPGTEEPQTECQDVVHG